MRIATWNVNSIKQRVDNAVAWIRERNPDIVCLQETKCVDEAFPREPFEALGYNVAVHGQKTFNGVAILSKLPFDEVTPRLPGEGGAMAAEVGALRLRCRRPCAQPFERHAKRLRLRTRVTEIVIARETLEFGWWEAVVIERNGDLVTVRYRDYPDFPPQVRHRSFVALIDPPAT